MSNNTITGRKSVRITYANGQSEPVDVRELSIRELYSFVEALTSNSTWKLVVLATEVGGRPVSAAWIDSLAVESYSRLCQEAIAANFTRAVALAQGDPMIATAIAPIIQKTIATQSLIESMEAPKAEPTSPNGSEPSPAPAPSASAAATTSGSST